MNPRPLDQDGHSGDRGRTSPPWRRVHLEADKGPADEDTAAVDKYGRLHGVAALRVADTSILPTAPAVFIGELIAHAIRHNLH
ncbi:GMC oxidoreductase [Streptomyces sp. 8N114]|uniref:GMC oxidoreductase n=1 Tax=Streptomyces sp. 8N114 TaxID=3457419 RepID=UPI003FD46D8B